MVTTFPLRTVMSLWAGFALVAWPGASPRAQGDGGDPGSARNCIVMDSVRRTRIVDDRSILFYLRSGDIFYNQLASQCHGLKREGRFTYDVARGQICAETQIAVLRDLGGNWVPTSVCRMGLFIEVTTDEVPDIIEAGAVSNDRPRRRERGRIDVTPAELPPAEAAGTPAPDAAGEPR